jgi:NAD(P)-dependent dehydrogenase (short-subunit alcohol dehydrogenase family)
MPVRLSGKVALVTGASRGIGKGVALGLGEEGCTVYVTGKTFRKGDSNRPGSVTATAEEVSKIGGRGIAVVCDHRVDSQTEAVFQCVKKEQDRLDILVNNATSYSTDIGPPEDYPFWESALQDWDEMNAVGLRIALCSKYVRCTNDDPSAQRLDRKHFLDWRDKIHWLRVLQCGQGRRGYVDYGDGGRVATP